MTSTSTDSALPHNGVLSQSQLQAEFLAKLSSFETALLNQQHPRYRLPPEEVERLASSLKNSSFHSPVRAQSFAVANGEENPHLEANAPAHIEQQSGSVSQHPASFPQPLPAPEAQHAKSSSSAFDPILLSKSNDLIRAEINLKRLRIERTLQDSAKSRTDSTRDKELGLWLGPFAFDAAKVLNSSKSLVKPISGLETPKLNEVSSVSSSFDENTYYSSKGNSWSPSNGETRDAVDENPSKTQQHGQPDTTDQESASTALKPRVSGLGPPNDTNTDANIRRQISSALESLAPTLPAVPKQPTLTPSEAIQHTTRHLESLREESYSPPEPTDDYEPPPPEPLVLPAARESLRDTRNQNQLVESTRLNPQRSRESESYSPPPPPPPPPQNQNTTEQARVPVPAAPQPSHIPPLVLNNGAQTLLNDQSVQPIKQNGTGTAQSKQQRAERLKARNIKKAKDLAKNQAGTDGVSRGGSGNQIPPNSRKRRRELEESEENRRTSGHQQSLQHRSHNSPSPETYVKAEQLSPPTPSNQPPRRVVLREDGRADLEQLTPIHRALNHANDSDVDDANRAIRRVPQYDHRVPTMDSSFYDDSDGAQTIVRRRPQPEEPNLRRLASVQYASRPYTPGQPSPAYSIEAASYARPASQMVMDRPRYENYQNEQVRQASVSHRGYDRHGSPYIFSDELTLRQPASLAARAPIPRKRIVVDELGNEYIATPVRQETYPSASRDYYDESTIQAVRQPQYEQNSTMDPRNPASRQPIYEPHFLPERRVPRFQGAVRRAPEIIEIEDDEDDIYSNVPLPRIIARRRPIESQDDAMLMQPPPPPPPHPPPFPQYVNRHQIRSASPQPHPSANNGYPQYLSRQEQAMPMQNMPPPSRERAFSARSRVAPLDETQPSSNPNMEWRRIT